MACKECFEVSIRAVTFKKIVKLDNVEVLLSMKEFICIVTEQASILITVSIPLREMMLDKKHRCFERPVVNQREDFFLVDRVLDQLSPNLFIRIFPKHHVVYGVEKAGIIQFASNLLKSFVKCGI